MTRPDVERLPCPECDRPIGLTRAGVRLMPHRPGRSTAPTREDGMCAGSRTLVADLDRGDQ